MTTLTLPSPAKLNLFLHITGQRADGYHELQSIFQFIDFCDQISFSPLDNGEIQITPNIPGLPLEENLIYKAARLLQQKTGCTQGVCIQLDKILPMGGGLGGGSSNAATTLVGLNHLWQTGLGTKALAELGLTLGADVPIFVHGKAAWAEGVGDIITPMEDLAENWFVLVVPDCHVNTKEVFSHKDLTRSTQRCKMSAALRGTGRNDCESVVTKLHKKVANSLNLLHNFGQARMTGTGSCVFLEASSEHHAKHVLAKLPADYTAFAVKGLNHSPLHKAVTV
ncbi:MAG: 4-(cytidine 5'-diphospho)-2-C-methyl-D-erythritol kinase [Bermanella sp.]